MESLDYVALKQARDRLRTLGIKPYPAWTGEKTTVARARSTAQPGTPVRLAGRLLAWTLDKAGNGSGILADATGQVRLVVARTKLTATSLRLIDGILTCGDLVACNGNWDTQGVRLRAIQLLSKALLSPPPVPWPDRLKMERTERRTAFLRWTRCFFEAQGFLEVETPYLLGTMELTPAIRSFVTRYQDTTGKSRPLYLQTSPEHYMKRLLAQGYEKIYQICRFFRNGETLATHNPEFTGLEWYQAYSDYRGVMDLAEQWLTFVARQLNGEPALIYQSQTLDLAPPWERITVREALLRATGIDFYRHKDVEQFRDAARRVGVYISAQDSWEEVFYKLFLERVEGTLARNKPTFLIDYPAQLPSLAKGKPGDEQVVERFELYLAGFELANAFTELNDPLEQRERFLAQYAVKQAQEGYRGGIDEDLLEALAQGIPPTGGIAVGLDRLIMLFCNATTIGEVLLFPFATEHLGREA